MRKDLRPTKPILITTKGDTPLAMLLSLRFVLPRSLYARTRKPNGWINSLSLSLSLSPVFVFLAFQKQPAVCYRAKGTALRRFSLRKINIKESFPLRRISCKNFVSFSFFFFFLYISKLIPRQTLNLEANREREMDRELLYISAGETRWF